MKTLSREHLFYAFDSCLEPALTVETGEEFCLQTCDCFEDQLQSETDTLDALDWERINPATGPVAIKGVKAGDLLCIDIRKLEVAGRATMAVLPGEGALGAHLTRAETTILENSAGNVILPVSGGAVKISARPMLGVIGVAPAEGAVANGTPGEHGGNMDCTLIGQGARLYLRANTDGALFGCGDAHSVMGDGEVLICGAETPAEATLSVTVIDEPCLPTPLVENDQLIAVIASAGSTDEAYQLACDKMLHFLTKVVGVEENDAGRLMSLVGDLKFCQVVDPQVTVRFEFPQEILTQLGFTGLNS